jgi:hypothetical protein
LQASATFVVAVRALFLVWLYAAVCMVPWITPGSKPTCSMMSISPSSGQAVAGGLDSIQIAGQLPVPQGSLARTSTKP